MTSDDTPKQLAAIRRRLATESDEGAKKSFRKFVPTSQRVYGVRVTVLNEIVKQHGAADFALIEALWQAGAFEERLLAAKMLGRAGRQEPDHALRLIERFCAGVGDWAVCDTLATQGARGIVKTGRTELLDLSQRLVVSDNFWERRFAVVLLTNYARDETAREAVERIARVVADDSEYYVKKAVEWLDRDLKKGA
ncbi:MAG: DNA alkylation repair protein [Pyrinomonadaceae bacterium]